MTIVLTAKGVDFSRDALGFVFPVMTGLEFLNYFGGSGDRTVRNLAPGKGVPTVTGSPVNAAAFATFRAGTDFLTTATLDQAEVTLIAVARAAPSSPATAYKYLIGNYNGGGAAQGSNMFLNAAADSAPTVLAARTGNTTANLVSPDSAASFAFYASRVGAAYTRIDDKTHGLTASAAGMGDRSAPSGVYYRVGSSGPNLGLTDGRADMAFAAIYSRCLTDTEIDTVYRRVKAYLATKSLSI